MSPSKSDTQIAGCAGMIVMLIVTYIGVPLIDSFSGFLWTVGLATIGTMVVGIWVLTRLSSAAESRRQSSLGVLVSAGVATGNSVTCIESGMTLACDIPGGRLAIVSGGAASFVKAEKLIRVSIDVDGRTIVKIDNLSAAVGGFVGGALAGRTGALLGILSGKRTRSRKAFSVSLQIVTGDDHHPMLDVLLFRDTEGAEPSETAYRSAIVAAERFRSDAQQLIRSA